MARRAPTEAARRPSPVARPRALAVLDGLEVLYPEARCELDFARPFELLVSVVLSAQTTDQAVNRCTPALFARYPDAAALAAASPEQVEPAIRTIGLYRNKARHLVGLARVLVSEHGGEVPRDRAALESLPGVGRKSANVVLSNAFGVPAIAVDTHVGRLARRLGWSREEDPTRVEGDLRDLIPEDRWSLSHHLLIWHGRRCCSARAPACPRCPVAPLCPSARLAGSAAEDRP